MELSVLTISEKYFKRISKSILFPVGNSLQFAKYVWQKTIPEPVKNWGVPVDFFEGCLKIKVKDRDKTQSFSGENASQIIKLLKKSGLDVKTLQIANKSIK